MGKVCIVYSFNSVYELCKFKCGPMSYLNIGFFYKVCQSLEYCIKIHKNASHYSVITCRSDFWILSFRFSCTPHGPSAKFLVENGEYKSTHETKKDELCYVIVMLNVHVCNSLPILEERQEYQLLHT